MFVCSAGEGLIKKVLRIDILSPARDRTFSERNPVRHSDRDIRNLWARCTRHG